MRGVHTRFPKPYNMNYFFIVLGVLLFGCGSAAEKKSSGPARSGTLQLVAEDFASPVAMAVPEDGTGRLFICEQRGIIHIIEKGKTRLAPFLDLRTKIVSLGMFYDERGLLGIAFHPRFRQNRKFYVYYSAPSVMKGSNHKSVIAEYKASASDPNVAETAGRILLAFEQPEMNHNGGQLAFGPDGYLYIGSGDGGGADDQHGTIGNGQNLNTFLGKILRIDVDKGDPYQVPPDNPFVNKNAKPEIWAWGLRNPWRFAFDKETGRLFCADVGQNKYEEIDIIEKGKNYGWRIMEGNHCFDPSENCNTSGLVKPIDEYDHSIGKSVTGGFVYRGSRFPSYKGHYIFADWTGPFFMLSENNKTWTRSDLTITNKPGELRVLSFGEDDKKELYVLTSMDVRPGSKTGAVYKLILN